LAAVLLADRVRAQSDGQLDITVYAVGEVVQTASIPEALAEGVIQMAHHSMPFLGVPFGGVHYTQPGLFTRENQLLHVMWHKGGDDIIREGLEPLNLYYLGSSTITGSALLTTRAVKNLAGLKGLKIREFGLKAALFDKLGATVTMVPFKELYMALQTGVVDGYCGFHEDTKTHKMYEPCKFMMLPEIEATAEAGVSCNLDAWNALPDHLKAILEGAANRYAFDRATLWEYTDPVNITFFQEECGVQIDYWSDEDVAKIRAASMEIMEEEATKGPIVAKLVKLYLDSSKELGLL